MGRRQPPHPPNRAERRHPLPPGVVDSVMRRLWPPDDPYRENVALWAKEKLGIDLWSLQRAIGESVVRNRRTAVKSCHGAGKSFLAAVIIAWWIHTRPPEETFVVWTAPTSSQVSAVIGRELRGLLKKLDSGFRCTLQMDLYAPDGTLIGHGRKPADHDEHSFQGRHAKWLLVLLDEACGIPMTLWTAVRSLATAPTNRILAIGNPDDPATEFFEICKPGTSWHVIRIDAYSTPNFTMERHQLPTSVLELLVDHQYVDDGREDWGEESMLWMSKVRGEFPEVSDDVLISPSMIRRAYEIDMPGIEPGVFAFDIARFGEDETVGYRNRGGHVRVAYSAFSQDTMKTTEHIKKLVAPHQGRVGAWIDAVGIGSGVYDRLRQMGVSAWAYNGGESATNKRRFVNRRAETFWMARKLLMDELVDLDPDDKKLVGQLQNIKWREDASGRIRVETKDEMRKRGVKKSPDRADAMVMSLIPAPAVWTPVRDGGNRITGGLTDDLLDRAM